MSEKKRKCPPQFPSAQGDVYLMFGVSLSELMVQGQKVSYAVQIAKLLEVNL